MLDGARDRETPIGMNRNRIVDPASGYVLSYAGLAWEQISVKGAVSNSMVGLANSKFAKVIVLRRKVESINSSTDDSAY